MHIPDGFLSVPVAVGGFAVSGAALGWAVHRARQKLDERAVPVIGMTAAFVFAVQMLNFPIAGGTSGHFLGAAFCTAVLGPAAALIVMALVVGLQCLGFADGGLLALGTNVLNMGVIGCLLSAAVMWGARGISRRSASSFLGAAAAAAFLSVTVASAACAGELALSGTVPLWVSLPPMLGFHLIIGVGEALITVSVVSVLMASRPDLVAAWQAATVSVAPSLETQEP